MIQTLLDRFTKETPVAVMVRAMLANAWSDKNIDRIFRDTVVPQRQDHLLFSTVVNPLHLAVFKIKPSLHSAYISRREEIDITITAVYDKIAGAELAVSRQLVSRPQPQFDGFTIRWELCTESYLPATKCECSMEAICVRPSAAWMFTA